jgi:polysaccharide deacetylase family protein (PEP-CTERM system associated)
LYPKRALKGKALERLRRLTFHGLRFTFQISVPLAKRVLCTQMEQSLTNTMNSLNPSNPTILLTIDVEDWFQVENFKPYIPFSSWPACELRVEKNIHRLLDLFDAHPVPQATSNGRGGKPQATFFVLGWIAERLPQLIREIHARGHEIGSHGYHHVLCSQSPTEELRADLIQSKRRLEEITGAPIRGYRAPSFSINDDILALIRDCGYLYDSSFNSFDMHSRYGRISLPKNGTKGIAARISDSFYELPISNVALGGISLPWGGGAYFRLIPFFLFRWGVHSILKRQKAYLFYMHPWEIDPEQPRVKDASSFDKFRHYTNQDKSYSRLEKLLQAFREYAFVTCSEYLGLSNS